MTNLTFANLVDTDQIRELLEAHYKITGIGAGILDTDENILVAVGYHDICTRFHLVHPLAKLNCRESDAYVKAHMSECKDGYLDYRCKNGLVDVAVPIMIGDQHFATFFTGQFFYDDNMPDVEYFRKQAEKFGFDEAEYLEALDRVPVFSRDRIRKTVEYYLTLVKIIAGMGLKNLELRREASERNQAEEALRKSWQMLLSVLDNFPGIVFWKDLNSVYMGCNRNFSLAAGLSEPSGIVGRSDHELPWKNDAERYLADDRQVIESGAPKLNIIETLLHADGRVAWFETSKVPLFDEDGKVFAVLGSSNDITERVKAEEALRISQFIIDKASFGILRGRADAKILYANEYGARMLSYTQDELCSMSFFDIDPSLTRAFWQELRKEVTATGSSTFESVHLRKDGTTYPVEVMVNYQEFQGQEFGCSFFRDITERKRADEALRASEAEKALILNSTMDYVMYHDPDMKIVWANRNAGKLTNLPVEELIGRHCWEVVHKRDIPCEGCPVILARDTGEPQIIERDHINGLTLNMRAYPIKNDQGRLMGIAEFVSDITKRKRAEEALRKAHDDLESRVKERTDQLTSLTAELSLAEERERRRIATELHDQVGQTLILSKIKLDSLSLSQPTEKFEKQIKEIRKYLDQSIQDIRSLTFQLSPPLLYEVGFEAAVEWLGEEFEEKYGFQVEFQDDDKKKPLDEESSVALYQMVRELLLNVAKHAKAKKVRISIGKVSGKIKINVTDDGSGFDGLNGMRDKNKKSGFGLFNVRHRIEYMGGEFKIKSRIDQGTSITLILPVKTETNSTNGKKL